MLLEAGGAPCGQAATQVPLSIKGLASGHDATHVAPSVKVPSGHDVTQVSPSSKVSTKAVMQVPVGHVSAAGVTQPDPKSASPTGQTATQPSPKSAWPSGHTSAVLVAGTQLLLPLNWTP